MCLLLALGLLLFYFSLTAQLRWQKYSHSVLKYKVHTDPCVNRNTLKVKVQIHRLLVLKCTEEKKSKNVFACFFWNKKNEKENVGETGLNGPEVLKGHLDHF